MFKSFKSILDFLIYGVSIFLWLGFIFALFVLIHSSAFFMKIFNGKRDGNNCEE